ncbi:cellulose binding domain-containing protein [Spirosoma sp. KUDC1026]|uniref:cellulose binding domain-containing protein n=1 Tax=Spirosoma sp. KUDC1026 TaxID=2745947 RepID=UPI00159B8E53|nr:cellulose binding domain-containing protein [Spirosoma sp. KUDC1026]QKZ12735.1 hypothetical protein HU175_08860 [Spirosoma sp. KUDC1026]
MLGNNRKVRTIDIGAAEFAGTPTQPVTIIGQAQSVITACQSVNNSLAFTFSVRVAGTGPFTYALFRDNTLVNQNTASGSDNISFGLFQQVSDNYQIVVTTGCNSVTTTLSPVTFNPLPVQQQPTGGGSYCAGSPAPVVGLAGSQTGVNYQLLRGGSPVGSPLAGTGSAINFGPQAAAGIYTVRAINATTGCQLTFFNAASVRVNDLPTQYSVVGSGAGCVDAIGTVIALNGSQVGVSYQLLRDSVAVGSPVDGNGGDYLSLGLQNVGGTYTVRATNKSTGCKQLMSGSAVYTTYALPTQYAVTGGGAFCSGEAGVLVGLSGSQTGVAYQLVRDGNNVGDFITGTGQAISFNRQTGAGTYTVQARDLNRGCQQTMTGSVTVTVNQPPTVSIVPSALTGCAGNIITLSALGADRYVWNTGATTTSIPVTATGTGVYSVTGTITSTGCSATASQSITIYPLPAAPSVLTQTGQSYPGGQPSVTVDVNSGNVNLAVGGCTGTINWTGPNNTSGTSSPIVVSTERVGQFVYTATCTSAQGCTSPATSATVTVQGRLTVLHRDVDNYADNNAIQPLLVLQNQGSSALPLSALTLRYYLTVEGAAALGNLSVNYA